MAQELLNTPLFSDANLTEYLRFEGNSTATVGGNGTDSNMSYGSGKFGQAAIFNGTSSKITLSALLSGTGNWTVNQWIKSGAVSGNRDIFFMLGVGTTNQGLFLSLEVTTNVIHAEIWGGNAIGGSVDLGDGVFHMITFTRSGNTGTLYVDGVQVGSTLDLTPLNISSGNTFLGSDVNSANFASQTMDDFSFFTRALTASEIANLFNGFLTNEENAYFM